MNFTDNSKHQWGVGCAFQCTPLKITKVTSDGQFDRNDVKVGWIIHAINGVLTNTAENRELKVAKDVEQKLINGSGCRITFLVEDSSQEWKGNHSVSKSNRNYSEKGLVASYKFNSQTRPNSQQNPNLNIQKKQSVHGDPVMSNIQKNQSVHGDPVMIIGNINNIKNRNKTRGNVNKNIKPWKPNPNASTFTLSRDARVFVPSFNTAAPSNNQSSSLKNTYSQSSSLVKQPVQSLLPAHNANLAALGIMEDDGTHDIDSLVFPDPHLFPCPVGGRFSGPLAPGSIQADAANVHGSSPGPLICSPRPGYSPGLMGGSPGLMGHMKPGYSPTIGRMDSPHMSDMYNPNNMTFPYLYSGSRGASPPPMQLQQQQSTDLWTNQKNVGGPLGISPGSLGISPGNNSHQTNFNFYDPNSPTASGFTPMVQGSDGLLYPIGGTPSPGPFSFNNKGGSPSPGPFIINPGSLPGSRAASPPPSSPMLSSNSFIHAAVSLPSPMLSSFSSNNSNLSVLSQNTFNNLSQPGPMSLLQTNSQNGFPFNLNGPAPENQIHKVTSRQNNGPPGFTNFLPQNVNGGSKRISYPASSPSPGPFLV